MLGWGRRENSFVTWTNFQAYPARPRPQLPAPTLRAGAVSAKAPAQPQARPSRSRQPRPRPPLNPRPILWPGPEEEEKEVLEASEKVGVWFRFQLPAGSCTPENAGAQGESFWLWEGTKKEHQNLAIWCVPRRENRGLRY